MVVQALVSYAQSGDRAALARLQGLLSPVAADNANDPRPTDPAELKRWRERMKKRRQRQAKKGTKEGTKEGTSASLDGGTGGDKGGDKEGTELGTKAGQNGTAVPSRVPSRASDLPLLDLSLPSVPTGKSEIKTGEAVPLVPGSAVPHAGDKQTTTPGGQTRGTKPTRTGDIKRVFEHWLRVMRKDPTKALLTEERRGKIVARLEQGYSVERICAAIDGCARTPFNMGDNDRHKRYDDLTLILRNGSKLEGFEEAAGGPVTPSRSSEPRHRELPPAPPEAT